MPRENQATSPHVPQLHTVIENPTPEMIELSQQIDAIISIQYLNPNLAEYHCIRYANSQDG